jgi:hypothetical protein
VFISLTFLLEKHVLKRLANIADKPLEFSHAGVSTKCIDAVGEFISGLENFDLLALKS